MVEVNVNFFKVDFTKVKIILQEKVVLVVISKGTILFLVEHTKIDIIVTDFVL